MSYDRAHAQKSFYQQVKMFLRATSKYGALGEVCMVESIAWEEDGGEHDLDWKLQL